MKTTDLNGLEPFQAEALRRALSAAHNSYNIYSKFYVGACIYTDSGNFHPGVCMENASYGLTICAEISALSRAVTDGDPDIRSIAIVGGSNFKTKEKAVSPCGRCRQAINEFAMLLERDIEVICADLSLSTITVTSIKELLPAPFGLSAKEINLESANYKKRICKIK